MTEKTIYHQFLEPFRSYKEEIEGVENEDNKEKDLENELVIQKNKSEIEYKIQLGIYLESMKNSSLFNGIEVEEFQSNGTYKYLVRNHQIRNIGSVKSKI